jgi:hypothetical protein
MGARHNRLARRPNESVSAPGARFIGARGPDRASSGDRRAIHFGLCAGNQAPYQTESSSCSSHRKWPNARCIASSAGTNRSPGHECTLEVAPLLGGGAWLGTRACEPAPRIRACWTTENFGEIDPRSRSSPSPLARNPDCGIGARAVNVAHRRKCLKLLDAMSAAGCARCRLSLHDEFQSDRRPWAARKLDLWREILIAALVRER